MKYPSVHHFIFLLTLAISSAPTGYCRGAIIPYNTQTAYSSATIQASGTPITFETYNNAPYTLIGGTVTISGVTFADPVDVYANTTGFGPNANDLSTDLFGDGSGLLTVSLPTGVNSFGTNLISGSSLPKTAEISVYLVGNTGATPDFILDPAITPISNSSATTFFGFSSTSGDIAKLVFHQNSGTIANPGLDNVEFGNLNLSVPEPSAYLLVVAGVVTLLFLGRRRCA